MNETVSLGLKARLVQPIRRGYFMVRNAWPVWYTVLNRDARSHFAAHRPILSETQKKILTDLQRDGIAFSSLDELFPGENKLEELQAFMRSLPQPEQSRARKQFLLPFFERSPKIDNKNPFFKLALSKTMLDVVNSYDNMWRRLNYMALDETLPVGDAAPTHSQRWHRDPEEKRQMKFFLYLNDVDSEAGPFTYVRGSQFKGPLGALYPAKPPEGSYPPHGGVEETVDQEKILSATGKAGTVIFCDTAGLHRGGHAKSKHRLMFTAFYPSDKWTDKKTYTVSDELKNDISLAKEARYAVFLD
ncbi:MAG: phytanoyl-CoA dioxygenase family protein [Minisyncoccia bacterium]